MSDETQLTSGESQEKQQPQPVPPVRELPHLLQQYRQILSSPNVFFDNLDFDGGLKDPAIFHLSVALLNGAGTFLGASFRPAAFAEGFAQAYVGGFIIAAAFHFLSKPLGGEGTFKQTYRGVAYAMAPGVFMWMPLCNIFSYLYMFFLLRKVLTQGEKLSDNRANLVIGACALILVVIALVSVGYSLSKMFTAKPIE